MGGTGLFSTTRLRAHNRYVPEGRIQLTGPTPVLSRVIWTNFRPLPGVKKVLENQYSCLRKIINFFQNREDYKL